MDTKSEVNKLREYCSGMNGLVYLHLPTRMDRVKRNPGHPQCKSKRLTALLPSKWLAENTDNNNMTTSLSQVNDMAGTTQVLNESLVKTVQRADLKDIPQGLLSATRIGYNQMDVRDFLKKPILLSTVSWGTQAANTVLINKSLPQDAFAEDIYADKIRGFFGFRGTAVIRVQVNGNKFQAGRLLLTFIPQGNVTDSYPGSRLRSLKAATQLPRVELDLSCETEIVMEIPYISPTPFYNLTDGSGPFGRSVLLVYSPLATGTGSTTADVSMWVHFKDVELVTPVAQMADRRPSKKNITEAELSQAGDKPLSTGLMQISKAASSFAQIPMLSSIAAPAAWMLSAMSGAASAFGYSKPTSEIATTKVMNVLNFNMQNHNGVDMFPNMGLDAGNKLSVMPGYAGTDVDEMSLNHLVQIPAFISSTTWSESATAGTLLSSYVVKPAIGATNAVVNLWSTTDHTPLGYFSNFFQYWRGSIVFTFKVVKTGYHSGRLVVSYNPTSSIPTLDQTSYLMREIIDIRDSSEYRFVVPYVSTKQYQNMSDFNGQDGDAIGYLSVHVLNELVAPDTVANSVSLLVEVSGGPDFELACPRPYSAAPIILSGWAAQMGDVVPSTKSSGRSDKNQGLVAMGSAVVEEQTLIAASHCVGEKANSILQLLKRYTPVNWLLSGTSVPAIVWRCFTYGVCYSSDPVAAPIMPTGDYVSMFGPCFAYSRGSVRVCVGPPVGDWWNSTEAAAVSAFPDDSATVISSTLPQGYVTPGVSRNYQTGNGSIVVGANVPAYQVLHARLNRPSSSVNPEPVDQYTSAMKVGINTTRGGSNRAMVLNRAAGDDFALGYFIGVPLVTTALNFYS